MHMSQVGAIPLLATELLWQKKEGEELVMAPHDTALGFAARACAWSVRGWHGPENRRSVRTPWLISRSRRRFLMHQPLKR